MPADDRVEKVADLAATALMAAATYGPLPPPTRPADLAARAGEALRRGSPERWPNIDRTPRAAYLKRIPKEQRGPPKGSKTLD